MIATLSASLNHSLFETPSSNSPVYSRISFLNATAFTLLKPSAIATVLAVAKFCQSWNVGACPMFCCRYQKNENFLFLTLLTLRFLQLNRCGLERFGLLLIIIWQNIHVAVDIFCQIIVSSNPKPGKFQSSSSLLIFRFKSFSSSIIWIVSSPITLLVNTSASLSSTPSKFNSLIYLSYSSYNSCTSTRFFLN